MKVLSLIGCILIMAAVAGCVTLDGRTALIFGAPACAGPRAYAPAAAYNEASQRNLVFAPFGATETGWEIYAPRIQQEIHSRCAAQTPGFAAALARWQAGRGLTPDGALQPAAFAAMKAGWQARRPFVAARLRGACPDPPPQTALAQAAPGESYGGKTVLLRRRALKAYRRMVAAARRDLVQARDDPDSLRLFSGYRSPQYDAERCARDADCDGLARAVCSAHRTGLAADMVVGAAPGRSVDSSSADNRLFQSRTAVYRWLVANAGRYGFVNYVYEPWHWEWTGEPP
jgi:D-alanyl-D-alanine carboxypeptidase